MTRALARTCVRGLEILHPVEILDAFLLRQLGTDLDEQLGLQLGEPRQPAAHARPTGSARSAGTW